MGSFLDLQHQRINLALLRPPSQGFEPEVCWCGDPTILFCLEHSALPLLVLKAPSSTSYFDSQSYVDQEDALYSRLVYLRAWILL